MESYIRKKITLIVFFVIIFQLYKAQNYTVRQIDSIVNYAKDFSRKAPNKVIPLNEKNFEIAKKANYLPGMIESTNLLSISHLNLGHYEKALFYAQETEKKASEINDYKNICNGLRISASSYSLLGFDNETQEMMNSAFSTVDKITDQDDFFETRGNLYSTQLDIMFYSSKGITTSKFITYAQKSVNDYSKIKNTKIRNYSLSIAYSNLGLAFTKRERFDSAFYYMHKSLNLAKIEKNVYLECVALCNLVSTLKTKKNYQQAINYLEILIPLSIKINEINILKLSYHNMESCYDSLGNKEKKLEYLDKYNKLNDSLSKADRPLKETSIQKIVKEKEETFINEKENLYLLIIAACILSVLIFYFGFKAFKNYKLEREKTQHKENVIVEKESQLVELKQKVNYAFDEIIDLAKKDDPAFLTRFQEVYPDIIRKLLQINPQLQTSELKFCALLFLNFSSKDISIYTFVQHQSVQIRKNRIRKKLNIPSREDIYLWMKNLND